MQHDLATVLPLATFDIHKNNNVLTIPPIIPPAIAPAENKIELNKTYLFRLLN